MLSVSRFDCDRSDGIILYPENIKTNNIMNRTRPNCNQFALERVAAINNLRQKKI